MRKIMSFVVALCVMLNCFTVVSLAIDRSDLDEKTLYNITHSIEEQFPILLEADCQFLINDVWIGKPIHLYDVTTNGILSSREFYPLFSGDKLVATAIQVDEAHYQISAELCEELAKYQNKQVALLYDSTHCYMFDGAKETVLCEYEETVDARIELEPDMLKSRDLERTVVAPCCELDLDESRILYAMRTYYSVSVTGVPQVYDSICWAAMIAMINNCLNNTSLTAVGVAQTVMNSTNPNVFNQGMTDSSIVSNMYSHYSLQYNYYNGVRSDLVLQNNITSGYPIFGSFKQGSSGRHATVIYGINIVSGYISVLDPRSTTYNSTYSYAAYYSSGYYSYVSVYNNLQHKLTRTICKITSE